MPPLSLILRLYLQFNRLTKDVDVHCILNTCKNEKVSVDVSLSHHTAIAHNYDIKLEPCPLKRRRRTCSADASSVIDLTIDLPTNEKTYETTDETMSDTQTPASSVHS